MIDTEFAFKELKVWNKAIEFACAVIELTEKLDTPRNHFRLVEQIEAAAASVAQNIAEGKGRFSKKEFRQYLYIARGSLYETVTLLNIFQLRNWITTEQHIQLENNALEIAKMIKGLVNALERESEEARS
jgi:four helix bundle protein